MTFGGAGVLEGDLTPACAAALQAVLGALGKTAGPADVRTAPQRRHDALEEACRRLIGAGCLPERAGQPTQVQLHLTLDQLRDLPGATDAEAAWQAGQAGPGPQPTGSTQADPATPPTTGADAAPEPPASLRPAQPAAPRTAPTQPPSPPPLRRARPPYPPPTPARLGRRLRLPVRLGRRPGPPRPPGRRPRASPAG